MGRSHFWCHKASKWKTVHAKYVEAPWFVCQRPCYCICWFLYAPFWSTLCLYGTQGWWRSNIMLLSVSRGGRVELCWATHYKEALITCNIPELKLRRDKICLDFAKKLYTFTEFRKWLPKLKSKATGRTLRNAQKMTTQKSRTNRYLQSPISFMTRLCNNALK